MPSIIKHLRVGIDLQSLLNKKLTNSTKDLLRHNSYKGALGGITLFSQVFDLYLINRYSNINNDEILRWLKAADCEGCFRHIINYDEKTRDYFLENHIGVTIASDNEIVETLKNVSIAYYLSEAHAIESIQDPIRRVVEWKEIIRDLTKFATTEYDYRYNKKESSKLNSKN